MEDEFDMDMCPDPPPEGRLAPHRRPKTAGNVLCCVSCFQTVHMYMYIYICICMYNIIIYIYIYIYMKYYIYGDVYHGIQLPHAAKPPGHVHLRSLGIPLDTQNTTLTNSEPRAHKNGATQCCAASIACIMVVQ